MLKICSWSICFVYLGYLKTNPKFFSYEIIICCLDCVFFIDRL